MKIRSELKAGRDFDACANELGWWRNQVGLMQQYVNSTSTTPPPGLWFPTGGVATQLPEFPSTANRDMSGYCG